MFIFINAFLIGTASGLRALIDWPLSVRPSILASCL
jgi:hypothetical protein